MRWSTQDKKSWIEIRIGGKIGERKKINSYNIMAVYFSTVQSVIDQRWYTYIIYLVHIGSALQQGFDLINITSKASLKQWSGASLWGERGEGVV